MTTTNKQTIISIISSPLKGRKENQSATLDFLSGVDEISDLAMQTLAAGRLFVADDKAETLQLASLGYIGQGFANGAADYATPGPTKTVSFDVETSPKGYYQSVLGKKATKENMIFLYESILLLLDEKETRANIQSRLKEITLFFFSGEELALYQELLEKNKENQVLIDWASRFAVGEPSQFLGKQRCVLFELDKAKSKTFGEFAKAHKVELKTFEYGTTGARSAAKTWASFEPGKLMIAVSNTNKPTASIFETPETVLHVLMQIPQGFSLPKVA